jgi:membrane fusion protein, heavy metal efflux system
MLSRLVPAFLVGLLLSGLLTGELRAHEGHDHDAPVATAPASIIPRGEAVSERFEVVAVAQGAELILYLDRFATNAPVKDAAIAIETPDGPAKAEPKGDGSYRLAAPWLTKGGHVDLIVTVSVEGADDVLPLAFDISAAAGADQRTGRGFWAKLTELLTPQMAAAAFGGLLIGIAAMAFGRRRSGVAIVLIALAPALVHIPAFAHEGHDHDEPQKPQAAAGDRATVLPGGVIFIPKPVQRIFELRTLLTETGSFKRTVELPGRIIPDPNASGFVQAAVGGRLAPPAGGFPQLGARVKQGDVLAYVTQPMQAIDVSDMRQRQGELDQQISIVERRVKRFETLAPSGAVAQTQLDEARLELQGLRDRRASLDKIRREPEELIAPVAGVIAEGRPVAGQIVQSNAVIFQIVEPARLWIEALSFQALRDVQTASARTATGNVLSIAFRGSGFADRSQSVPVHFAVEDGADRLRAGEFVTVFVQTGDGKQGIALPRSAVIRASNGQDFVYEHVSAERFEARPVRTEPLDAERVLIAAGLDAGKRIVVQGAELVAHVR